MASKEPDEAEPGVAEPVAREDREDMAADQSTSSSDEGGSDNASKSENGAENTASADSIAQAADVLRIKDLDTGKEFIIGLGDSASGDKSDDKKVKDLQTGKELSLEEFEKSFSLPPIFAEVERRERGIGGPQRVDKEGEEGKSGKGVGKQTEGKKSKFSLRYLKSKFRGRNKDKQNASASGSIAASVASSASSANSSPSSRREGRNSGLETAFSSARELPETDQKGVKPTASRAPVKELSLEKSKDGIKVNVHKKDFKELSDVKMTQELNEHSGPIWVMKFNVDGKMLATAGQDAIVRVWAVEYRSPKIGQGRDGWVDSTEGDESANEQLLLKLNPEPHQVYTGHTEDVLDLSWSKTNFLLSASMDKTVRLWHTSMSECLRIFTHNDYVTSIDFNPTDDKVFISGSLDEKLRLWNIPEHHVTDWVDVHEMITAACFSGTGKSAVVGTVKGGCRFYTIEGNSFDYVTQVDVRSKRGKNARGKKITGVQFMPGDDTVLLVTSNDSRIRVYEKYSLKCKYKGFRLSSSQIKASFSPGGDFIISGSEDQLVYMWSTVNSYVPPLNSMTGSYRKTRQGSFESFKAHDSVVTAAVFARPIHIPQKAAPPAASAVEPKPPPPKVETPVPAAEEKKKGKKGKEKESKKKKDEEDDDLSEADENDVKEAQAAGQAAFQSAAATNQVVVTASYSGEIRVYENVGLPQKL